MREKSPRCSGLTVAIRPDHHKGGFGEALGLEPSFGATGAIVSQRLLGNDAFKSMLSAGLEKGLTLSAKF